MEYARVKVLSLRRKLCSLQKEVLELAHKHQVSDYRDPRVRWKHRQVVVIEFVLEGWMDKYKEESQIFWKGDNLNRLE